MSSGLGFSDLAAERLKRDTELDRIAALLNWGPLSYRLEKHCRKQDGRPPFAPAVMFRALLLAQWYGLSDRDLEDALCDRLSFRRFVGLGLEQATPDHTTLCRFRERLNEAGLTDKLLALVNAQIEAKGLMLKRGTLIDATVVETAAARPAPQASNEPVDPDAAFLKHQGKPGSAYGYKAHVAVDQGSLLVRQAKLTPANVAETLIADELILATRDAGAVYADKAYDTKARRALLATLAIEDHIMHRPNKHHPMLPPELTARNAANSKIRCAVETVFAVFKRIYGYRRTRYFGLVRNQLQLTLLAICFNLRRAPKLTTHGRSPSPA